MSFSKATQSIIKQLNLHTITYACVDSRVQAYIGQNRLDCYSTSHSHQLHRNVRLYATQDDVTSFVLEIICS